MTEIKNIKTLNTTNWQHKRGSIGGVATDLEDIEQCYETICSIQKGKAVHSPNLGWDILKYIDKPINEVMAQIKQELMKELNTQEPRAKVINVEVLNKSNEEFIKRTARGHCSVVISYIFLDSEINKEKEVQLW